MNASCLIVVTDGQSPTDEAADEAYAALASWPEAARPRVRAVSLDRVLNEPGLLDGAAAAWCVLGQASAGDLFELVGIVQERHLPAMLTRKGEVEPAGALYDDGVLVCPPGLDPAVAGAMLRGLVSQSPVIRLLQAEIGLLRKQQGGLSGEIDRMGEELRLAAQLQREFLPATLPALDGVAFNVLWRPATYVSGDIYDVIRLDENHLGFFVADAVGHGVPAALLTMFIKRSLHTKVIDPSLPAGYRIVEPHETMTQLNRDLLQHNRGQVRFTTACYGIIDQRTLTVRLARGGHPYPFILRSDGRTEQVDPEGALLGVFEDEAFEQTSVKLAVGDRLLVYSDGFEMAFPGQEPGAGRGKSIANLQYAREFEDLRHGSLDAALHRLEAKLDSQAGSLNQRDDLTVLGMTIGETQDKHHADQSAVTVSRSQPRAAAST